MHKNYTRMEIDRCTNSTGKKNTIMNPIKSEKKPLILKGLSMQKNFCD